MSQLRRGRASQGGKDAAPDDARNRTSSSIVSEKPKSASEGGNAWGKPRDGAPPRAHASSSSSSANGSAPKAKAPPKTPFNIAALAARNLGGFVPNKIFVGGVPITCTEEAFRSYFEPFGAISKVELHALRGFGYITYESVEAVDACLEKYEDHYLSKKWVEVKRSIPRELIDSYDREQRRLHAEYLAAGEAQASPTSIEATQTTKAAADSRATQATGVTGPSSSGTASSAGGVGLPSGGVPGPSPGAGPGPTSVRKGPSAGGGGGGLGGSAGGGWGMGKEPPGSGNRIKQLTEMGFSEEVAKRVLSECVWDVNKAIDRLLTDETLLADSFSGAQDVGVFAATQGEQAQVLESASEQAHRGASALPADDSHHHPWPDEVSAALPAVESAGVVADDLGAEEEVPSSIIVNPGHATVETNVVAPTAAGAWAPSPKKRIERVVRSWEAEDQSQLSVVEHEFVNVWVDTGTDHGWIHAERRSGDAEIGWLPVCVLQPMPEKQRWMSTRQTWQGKDESQCNIDEGAVVVVWISTRTPQGWTYVEVEDGTGNMRPGWLPVFCLEWNED
mmetsp:Transcript_109103/g.307583  ORF Transcript_109103/g.307583 Transcript_109103/m.307583 type:complete len:562 (+) Transcript_109103:57-1742(+)